MFKGLVALMGFWVAMCMAAPSMNTPAPAIRQVATQNRKVALVVGNAAYRFAPLANPVADARAMGKVLGGIGFDTEVVTDADRLTLLRSVAALQARAADAAVVLFYFAGHGVQINGRNYLVPTDVDLSREEQVRFNALDLTELLATLGGHEQRTKIVILDACRDNPYAASHKESAGLAVPNVREGSSMLIAFSTAPGRVASDGKRGSNGLYTAQLLKHLAEPGMPIESVFKRTRADVVQQSKGQQIPWEDTSLLDDVVLAPGVTSKPGAEEPLLAFRPEHRAWRVGDRFQDCERCPAMTVLPAGAFAMGAPETEAGRQTLEGPQHSVSIAKPFAIGQHEVTFAEWEACLLDGGCERWPADEGWGRGARPVINVSWEDASRYAAWLSRRTGRRYRLPTEAEWEYAARAGSVTARYWGDELGRGHAHCKDCGQATDKTQPVGSYPPNRWGLSDMLGNVWEWTNGCRTTDIAGIKDAGSISGGDCAFRAIRGGAWATAAKGVRAATRSFYPASRRDSTIGFRVAADPQ